MSVSEVKNQVASLLAERRGGSIATSGSGQMSPLIKVAAIGGVIGMAGWLVLPKMFTPKVTAPIEQGSPQLDQAMQMLQQQQDMNQKLLQGQQELNALMIKEQGKHKPVQPNINCFLAVCPGTGQQEAPNDGQYAIAGESIKTAVVNPTQVLPQLQQPVQTASAQAPQYYQQPVQTIGYTPELADQYTSCTVEGWQSQHCQAVAQRMEAVMRGL